MLGVNARSHNVKMITCMFTAWFKKNVLVLINEFPYDGDCEEVNLFLTL